MTKQLTPLRRKDQATGYQAAVKDIVAWIQTKDNYDFDDLVIDIKTRFGKTNGN